MRHRPTLVVLLFHAFACNPFDLRFGVQKALYGRWPPIEVRLSVITQDPDLRPLLLILILLILLVDQGQPVFTAGVVLLRAAAFVLRVSKGLLNSPIGAQLCRGVWEAGALPLITSARGTLDCSLGRILSEALKCSRTVD